MSKQDRGARCVVCQQDGPVEWHHLARKVNDKAMTVPVCPPHHVALNRLQDLRGIPTSQEPLDTMDAERIYLFGIMDVFTLRLTAMGAGDVAAMNSAFVELAGHWLAAGNPGQSQLAPHPTTRTPDVHTVDMSGVDNEDRNASALGVLASLATVVGAPVPTEVPSVSATVTAECVGVMSRIIDLMGDMVTLLRAGQRNRVVEHEISQAFDTLRQIASSS